MKTDNDIYIKTIIRLFEIAKVGICDNRHEMVFILFSYDTSENENKHLAVKEYKNTQMYQKSHFLLALCSEKGDENSFLFK